jgi:RNA polymerase sigma-70 factor (ECF subfamily)
VNLLPGYGDEQGMPREYSDDEVIARSLRDPEAFAAIFDRHHGVVHNYLRRRVGRDLADEWLAETFTEAFRARGRYRPAHDSCRPWLLGIAAHLIANHRRAERRRLAALEREAADSRARLSHRDHLNDHVVDAELVRALRSLGLGDREVLLLYAWAGLTYAEIATALSLPVGTVRSRLNRARNHVRARLEGEPLSFAARRVERPSVTGDGHA